MMIELAETDLMAGGHQKIAVHRFVVRVRNLIGRDGDLSEVYPVFIVVIVVNAGIRRNEQGRRFRILHSRSQQIPKDARNIVIYLSRVGLLQTVLPQYEANGENYEEILVRTSGPHLVLVEFTLKTRRFLQSYFQYEGSIDVEWGI